MHCYKHKGMWYHSLSCKCLRPAIFWGCGSVPKAAKPVLNLSLATKLPDIETLLRSKSPGASVAALLMDLPVNLSEVRVKLSWKSGKKAKKCQRAICEMLSKEFWGVLYLFRTCFLGHLLDVSCVWGMHKEYENIISFSRLWSDIVTLVYDLCIPFRCHAGKPSKAFTIQRMSFRKPWNLSFPPCQPLSVRCCTESSQPMVAPLLRLPNGCPRHLCVQVLKTWKDIFQNEMNWKLKISDTVCQCCNNIPVNDTCCKPLLWVPNTPVFRTTRRTISRLRPGPVLPLCSCFAFCGVHENALTTSRKKVVVLIFWLKWWESLPIGVWSCFGHHSSNSSLAKFNISSVPASDSSICCANAMVASTTHKLFDRTHGKTAHLDCSAWNVDTFCLPWQSVLAIIHVVPKQEDLNSLRGTPVGSKREKAFRKLSLPPNYATGQMHWWRCW